ncbi:MAG: thioredoxin [Eubacteriales bacterium]|nr:thioredoxin [bacterium]MDY2792504.1 thioredoxin [Eubacteriales bacterium]
MAEITLTKDNFEEQVLRADRPVLVDFWATWCGPCRMLAPIVAEIAEERDDVTVGKVNVDDESELAARYGVSSIPTVILFKDGKVSATSVGYRSKAQLLAALGL